jgi:ribosomal protein S18 acetylase RimI-like enzyme
MRIRTAVKNDINSINQMSDDLHIYLSKLTGVKMTKKELIDEHVKSEKEFKKDNYYVAEQNGCVIGCVIFGKKVEIGEFKGRHIEIHHLFVSKGYRRKGIGKKFSEIIKKYAKTKNANIRLGVNFENKAAISFYKKMGFFPFGLEMLWRLK